MRINVLLIATLVINAKLTIAHADTVDADKIPEISCQINDNTDRSKTIRVVYDVAEGTDNYNYGFDSGYRKFSNTDFKVRIHSQYELVEGHDLGDDATNLIFTFIAVNGSRTAHNSLEMESFEDLDDLESPHLKAGDFKITCSLRHKSAEHSF